MEPFAEAIVARDHVLTESLQTDHVCGDVVPVLHELDRGVRRDLVFLLVSSAQRLVQAQELVLIFVEVDREPLRPHPHDEHLLHRRVSEIADHRAVLSQRPLRLMDRVVVRDVDRIVHHEFDDSVVLRPLDEELAAQTGAVSSAGSKGLPHFADRRTNRVADPVPALLPIGGTRPGHVPSLRTQHADAMENPHPVVSEFPLRLAPGEEAGVRAERNVIHRLAVQRGDDTFSWRHVLSPVTSCELRVAG